MKSKKFEVVSYISEISRTEKHKIIKNGVEVARGNNLKELLAHVGQT